MNKPNIIYLNSSPYNFLEKSGLCKNCLELSTFRHVRFNQKSVIMCTRCLTTHIFRKKYYVPDNLLFYTEITKLLKLIRVFKRIKLFLFGNWCNKSFNTKFLKWGN